MENFDQYLTQFDPDIQAILKKIRNIILKIAPDSQESMAYGMPAYKLYKKPLVYFAAFKNHIGFYATPSGHAEFSAELAPYKQGKGSVQFPLNKSIPYSLIERMVTFRKEENENKSLTAQK